MIRILASLIFRDLTYYAFLFFFGFFVCYIWAHNQREELTHKLIEITAINEVIEELCFKPKGGIRYGR